MVWNRQCYSHLENVIHKGKTVLSVELQGTLSNGLYVTDGTGPSASTNLSFMAGPRLGKAWWSDPVPTQVGVGGWGSCPYTTKQEEAQPRGRERMEALDEGWVHSLRSWASLNFMSPSAYWCPQPSGTSRVSYTISPGGLSVGLGCLWLTTAQRVRLESTSVLGAWGTQGPDATIKFDLLIHLHVP